MKTISHCPICYSQSTSDDLLVKDHMVSQESFHVVTCSSCQLQRTSPRPELIAAYYESDDYLSHSSDAEGLFAKLYGALRLWAASKKVNFLEKQMAISGRRARLMDVGCGIGVFLEKAKSKEFDVFGVELSDLARKQAEKRLNQPIFTNLDDVVLGQTLTSPLDGVSLFHVLEHLPDPAESLRKLHDITTDDAVIVLGLPNPESWDAKHYGSHWAPWDVPIHFWHFTKGNIKELASRNGWSLDSIHPMPLDAFYVSLLSEQFKGRKGVLAWFFAVCVGAYSNLRGGRQNASSLLYVLRKPS